MSSTQRQLKIGCQKDDIIKATENLNTSEKSLKKAHFNRASLRSSPSAVLILSRIKTLPFCCWNALGTQACIFSSDRICLALPFLWFGALQCIIDRYRPF